MSQFEGMLVDDREQIPGIVNSLKTLGVPHRAIREPDPPYRGELLAIGLEPAVRSKVSHYVSSLPLLKEKEEKTGR